MRPDLPLRRMEMQVRRKPIRRASRRIRAAQIYSVVVMFLCLTTVIALGSSPAMAARHLNVNGDRFTGEPIVSGIVGIDGAPNLFRLRTDRIAETLVKLPAILSAKVEVRLPDTIVVTVVERQPRLVWVIGERRYVVDDNGLIFGEVDGAGNPIALAPDYLTNPAPSAEPSANSSAELTADNSDGASETPDGAAASSSASAKSDGRAAQAAKATPRPTPRATPAKTAKATPKATARPSATATTVPEPTTTVLPAPSLLPVQPADPAATQGPEAVALPVVYDRRADDAALTFGDSVDFVSLDAGYRLANLTPADVGSLAQSLYVVLDDQYGYTLSCGADGWVAEFGFYTETVRKDTVIPEQVRDLRSTLLYYKESHVAWVWLMADIAGNRLNGYLAK
jgi:hypothetical protein